MALNDTATDVVLIEQLNARTTHALDGLLPPEAFANAFTADGVLSVGMAGAPPMEESKGQAALLKACQHISNPEGARHFSLNVIVDVDGDRAQLTAYSMVVSIKVQPRTVLRTSRQTDTLVREADGWRIAKRVLTIDPGGRLE